jgi:hypothetical protein
LNAINLGRVCVIDSHPGSGKTSFAIQYINELPSGSRILFITPFLKECERIQEKCPKKFFKQPDRKKGSGYKPAHFLDLIKEGENVASTHVLFSIITDEMIAEFKRKKYILILDEVMNVVSKINVYDEKASTDKKPKYSDEEKDRLMKEDVRTLVTKNLIRVDDDCLVHWTSEDCPLGKYSQIKELADRQLLYMIDDELLAWTFPIEVFEDGVFEKIFILTYMFDYQIQAYYYNFFGLEYKKYFAKDVGDGVYGVFEASGVDCDDEWRRGIGRLIDVCDISKLNMVGSFYRDSGGRIQKGALSKSWYERADSKTMKALSKNMSNYLKNITNSKASQRMWTCFKDYKEAFENNKELSAKHWIELNARATNDYGDRTVLVYPINRFLNPFYEKFFAKKGVCLDQEKYALSEMIQWVWRSAIRNGESIRLYVPSQRMRELLVGWLEK